MVPVFIRIRSEAPALDLSEQSLALDLDSQVFGRENFTAEKFVVDEACCHSCGSLSRSPQS